jgi:glycosyltransferase involved in cell wall biosynthesis
MESKAYHECDLLLCVTQALKEIVVEAFGISAEKVVVIPNGVDTAFFDPARYQPKRLFPTLTVGFVGNLYIWSGVDLLIQAIAELRSEGMSISAVVVGDGVMRSEWEALAQQLGIMQHVAFTGRVSRDLVPTYIAGFDVGYSGQRALQLGHMYHSPLKIYEYMSMAKPVIASAFQDAQDALRDGIDGFLFIPSDKESLKQALRRASVSQDALGGMGEAARIQALKFHSWTARISSLMRAVDQLTAGPRVPRSRLTDRGGAP